MIVVYRRLRSAFKTSRNLSQSFYYSASKRLIEIFPPFGERANVCTGIYFLFPKICIRKFTFEIQLARPIDDNANAASVLATGYLEVTFLSPSCASAHSDDPVVAKCSVSAETRKNLRRIFSQKKQISYSWALTTDVSSIFDLQVEPVKTCPAV